MKIGVNTLTNTITEGTIELNNGKEQLFVKAGSGYIQVFIDTSNGGLYYRVHGTVRKSNSAAKSNAYIKERFERE